MRLFSRPRPPLQPSASSSSVSSDPRNQSPATPVEDSRATHSPALNNKLPGPIFGSELQNSVALAHSRLEVKDFRGEMRTLAYVPTVIAKCGIAIKTYTSSPDIFTPPPLDLGVLSGIQSAFEVSPKYGRSLKWERYPKEDIHHLASAMFLRFLNELPIPVVPEDHYAAFDRVYRDSVRQKYRVTTCRYAELLCKLPMSHMYVLLYVMDMLDIMSRHALLEIPDLARHFAPAVFRASDAARRETAGHILEDLIKHRDIDATIQELNQELADRPPHAIQSMTFDLTFRSVIAHGGGDQTPSTSASSDHMDIDDPPASDWSEEQSSAATTPAIGIEGVPDITEHVQRRGQTSAFRGGFSQIYTGVYRNPESGTEHDVALRLPILKYADDVVRRRFLREVEIWFNLKHPNINVLLGTFLDDLGLYMVSPWQTRGSMKACYENRADFDHLIVLHGTVSALSYLHESGYVHGDLKMENVLLAEDGQPLLTDFGLSKKTGVSVATSTDSKVACSFPWASPEIIMGGGKSQEGDVYAFGMVIAELLTRRAPFASITSVGKLTMAIMNGQRPLSVDVELDDAPNCWSQLWEIAERCWQADRTRRPSMQTVLMDLDVIH